MSLSSHLVIMAAVVGITMSAPPSEALVQKPPTQKTEPKKTTKISKKGSKKLKTGKKIPFVLSSKTPEVLTPEAPHRHHFSPEMIETLAHGDLHKTYHNLQLEEASDKVGYMLNQVLIAQGKGTPHGVAISSFDRATAWHNLYLFMARQGRTTPKFLKEAAKYYQKAARKPLLTDKANVLLAALYATAGNTTKSEKFFNKVNRDALTRANQDYNGLEYLATYYAATKQTQKALAALDLAYKLNPGPLLLWLHVGDDFESIEEDPLFQEQVAIWQLRHKERLAQLQRDKTTHDARKKSALASKKKSKKSVKKSGKKHR